MKIQLAYRFTGEDEDRLVKTLEKICSCLKEAGHETYCPVLNPDRPTEKKDLFLDTLNKLNDADAILALVKSEDKSEGMLMEIGCAIGKGKEFILVINENVKSTHLRELANRIIEFNNVNDLYNKIEQLET